LEGTVNVGSIAASAGSRYAPAALDPALLGSPSTSPLGVVLKGIASCFALNWVNLHNRSLLMTLRLLPTLLLILASLSSALSADEPVVDSEPFQLPKLPRIDFSQNMVWYPDRARVAGLEGRALVAFDITR
jgi:hypothetical protein